MPKKPIPLWKKSLEELDLEEEPVEDVITEWARHLHESGWLRGHWRRTVFINRCNQKIDTITAEEKKNGRIFSRR